VSALARLVCFGGGEKFFTALGRDKNIDHHRDAS
jgi:hypothetical protein